MRFARLFYFAALAAVVGAAGTARADFFAASQPAEPQGAPVFEPAPAFAANTWTFQSYGSATMGKEFGYLYEEHTGFGYYFLDGLSGNFEATFAGIHSHDQGGDHGGDLYGGGFDLLARWHFIRAKDWSVYLEGGGGVLQTDHSFPAHGTNFNFTPQVGVGITAHLFDDLRLMAGFRYQHISNANLTEGRGRNPGFDGGMIYLGVMVPF